MQTLRSLHMKGMRNQLPDLAALTAGLRCVFAAVGGDDEIAIVERIRNDYSSTFPSEIVRCRLGKGIEVKLLCKYEAGHGRNDFSHSHTAHGHRSGPKYEAKVYRNILSSVAVSSPHFFGQYTDGNGDIWLVLEYVEGSKGADESQSTSDALLLATRWVAQFHGLNEAFLPAECGSRELSFLKVYDQNYYRQWSERTLRFAAGWCEELPWLRPLCDRHADFVAELTALPLTIIHGEFTPHNVLVRGDQVYPVDWESAAIAFGELDLIALTDKWPEKLARDCEIEYAQIRWGTERPEGYERRLEMARLCWDFRWLGDRPEWTSSRKVGARFEHLRASAARLGLL